MIYTSYHNKPGVKDNPASICIALNNQWWGRRARCRTLNPTRDMHQHGYTEADYFKLMDERISDLEAFLREIDGHILCCHEKDPAGCHRRMFARYVKSRLPEFPAINEIE